MSVHTPYETAAHKAAPKTVSITVPAETNADTPPTPAAT